MNTRHTGEMLERTSLYALGALEGAELAELELHLENGCPLCAEALRGFRQVTDNLLHAAGEVKAPPSLRDRALARVASEAALETQPTIDAEGVLFVRSGSLDWQKSPIPGFNSKVLFRDSQRELRTQLVRLAAGAAIPPHLHTDVEELYVLEGELIVNDVVMKSGDYCRAALGTLHRTTHSPNGCVLPRRFERERQSGRQPRHAMRAPLLACRRLH